MAVPGLVPHLGNKKLGTYWQGQPLAAVSCSLPWGLQAQVGLVGAALAEVVSCINLAWNYVQLLTPFLSPYLKLTPYSSTDFHCLFNNHHLNSLQHIASDHHV